jgi:uncharacterized membrane protein (DUF4010 family)
MTELEVAQRLGVALAIGALVGAERHWRDRGEDDGQRTAGLRTYTLIGMLGGVAGALELALRGTATGPAGIVLVGVFIAFALLFGRFQLRELQAEQSYSVTSVIAGMVTFALGALAVLGDMRLAGAAGVVLVAILAAREALHRFVEALTFAELRSAIVLLAMTFVVLPLVPTNPVGPFGGVSPARIWTLAILVAAISFAGYVAVKLLGERNGELVAGAVGGLLSSTATTVTNARRSMGAGETDRLVAGALGAGVVSYGRTALLVLVLAPALLPIVAPPLAAAGLVMASAALWLARRDTDGHVATDATNPFDLQQVLQMAVFLTAIAFATRAAAAWFGDAGAVAVSAITGLADVDAPVITVAGLFGSGLSAEVASTAMIVAVTSNTVAKAGYALLLGAWRFGAMFAAVTVAALMAGGAGFAAARLLG